MKSFVLHLALCSPLVFVGLGLLIRAHFLAPLGHEDAAGFHLGPEPLVD